MADMGNKAASASSTTLTADTNAVTVTSIPTTSTVTTTATPTTTIPTTTTIPSVTVPNVDLVSKSSSQQPLSSAVSVPMNVSILSNLNAKLKKQVSVSKNSQIEERPEVASWYDALGIQQRLQVVLQYMLRPLEREDEEFYVPNDLLKIIVKFAHWSVFHLWNYGKHDEAVQVMHFGLNARCISPENKIAIVLFGDKIRPNSGLKYRVRFKCVRMINYQAVMCVGEDFKYQVGTSWPEWPRCTQNVVIWYSDAYVPRWYISDSAKKVKSGSLFAQGHILVAEVNMTEGVNRVRFENETTKAPEDNVPVDGVPFPFHLGCILSGNGSEVTVLEEEYFK